MAVQCTICKKQALNGNRVSHSNKKTHHLSHPNLQTVRALFEGTVQRIRVCTRCLRSGFVTKAA